MSFPESSTVFQFPYRFRNFLKLIIATALLSLALASAGFFALFLERLIEEARVQQFCFLELKEEVSEATLAQLILDIKGQPGIEVDSVRYISREEGLRFLSAKLDETPESLMLFEENLLPAIIQVAFSSEGLPLVAGYIGEWEQLEAINIVYNEISSFQKLENIRYLPTIIALVCIIFFIFVAHTLTQAQVSLLMLGAKEDIRKAQQLQLASKKIVKPFVTKAVNGFLLVLILMQVLLAVFVVQFVDNSSIFIELWTIAGFLSASLMSLQLYLSVRSTVQRLYFKDCAEW